MLIEVVFHPVTWRWHKDPPNYATRPSWATSIQYLDLSAPSQEQDSVLCLVAHGRSHERFPVAIQTAIRKVPPLDIDHPVRLLHFTFSTRHRISDDEKSESLRTPSTSLVAIRAISFQPVRPSALSSVTFSHTQFFDLDDDPYSYKVPSGLWEQRQIGGMLVEYLGL